MIKELILIDPIPEPTLRAIEKQLHAVIRRRLGRLLDKHWPLPSLFAMVAHQQSKHFFRLDDQGVWCWIAPNIMGGFHLRWISGGAEAKLESLSFSRLADGWGKLHEITAARSELMQSGLFPYTGS